MFSEDFSTFRYDDTLHLGRKHCCLYCLRAFRTAEKLKFHINDDFESNTKKQIKMPEKC